MPMKNRELHNLYCQRYRLKKLQEDPQGWRQKERQRWKKYYTNNRAKIIKKNKKYNKEHAQQHNEQSLKSYHKRKIEIKNL